MTRLLLFLLTMFGGVLSGNAHAGGPISGIAESLTVPIAMEDAPALAPPDPTTVEVRTHQLASELRCPVCQGLSVADSNSEAARNMKQRVRELVEQGYSDDQILAYFVSRYGAWIRLEPPVEGMHWLIFVAPGAIVLLGLVIIGLRVRGGTVTPVAPEDPLLDEPPREEEATEVVTPAAAAPSIDDYKARILAELGDDASGGEG